MDEIGKILGDAFLAAIRQAVREEIRAANGHVVSEMSHHA